MKEGVKKNLGVAKTRLGLIKYTSLKRLDFLTFSQAKED
jgi:hypothetical protein